MSTNPTMSVNGDFDPSNPPLNRPHVGIGLGGAVGRYFAKYFTFSGRASRSEYWWAWLFVAIVGFVLTMLTRVEAIAGTVGWVALAWMVLTIIPSLSVAVRRLHDRNRSGWMVLLPSLLVWIGQFIALFALYRAQDALGAGADLNAIAGEVSAQVLIGGALLVIGALASLVLYVGRSKPEGARFDK